MVAEYTVHGDSFDAGRPRIWSSQQIGSTVFNPNLDLSADGKRFVVFSGTSTPRPQTGSAHVVFLLNFFDELRRRIPAGRK
jgi:serine/threonine-protein kinase